VTDVSAVVPVEGPAGRSLARSGAIVAVAILVTNGVNAAFNIAMAHLLRPEQYSLLAALFAIVLIANVPSFAIQAGVARDVARLRRAGGGSGAYVLRGALRAIARLEAILLGVGVLAAYPIVRFAHVKHPWPVVATVVAVCVSMLVPIGWGALQGQERFVALGASQLLQALLKLGGGIVLAALGLGVAAVMFGLAGATLLAGAATFALAGLRRRDHGEEQVERRAILRYSGDAALTVTLFAALTYADLLAARLALPHEIAGTYAAVSIASRVMFLIANVATTVLFPRVATLADGARERQHLMLGLGVVAIAGGISCASAFAFARPLVVTSLGAKYAAAVPWLGWLTLVMLIFALVNIFQVHFLALGRATYAVILGGGLVLELVLFALFHGSPRELIADQLVAGAVVVAVSEAYDRLTRT
jgi:O-antigen/teichoic acid export membrane protein